MNLKMWMVISVSNTQIQSYTSIVERLLPSRHHFMIRRISKICSRIIAGIMRLYYYFEHGLVYHLYLLTMVASKRSLRSLLLKPTSKLKLPSGISHCWEIMSQ
jgi:hypothetical protein